MWSFLVAHKHEVQAVAGFWVVVQIAAGMPTPTPQSNWKYVWTFNVMHAIAIVPRFLATAFPQVGWIAALFGVQQNVADSTAKK